MYFTYISPKGSCYYNDKEQQNGIINMLSRLECIRTEFFAWDMNSRCKDYLDFIPDDTLSHIFGNNEYEGSYFDLPRSYRNNLRANNFGKSLVNLCWIFDDHFLNGRFFCDIDGNFTCIWNDGASVVDYTLASSGLFNYIKDFYVIDRDESDHFPISCLLKLNQLPNPTPVNIMAGNLLPSTSVNLMAGNLLPSTFVNIMTGNLLPSTSVNIITTSNICLYNDRESSTFNTY